MKKKYFILLFCLWVCGSLWNDVEGQKVYAQTENGRSYAVVDLTDLLPLGCVRQEKTVLSGDLNAVSATAGSDNYVDGKWNKKMYYKFEISKSDETRGLWYQQFNRCKNKTDAGGGWRLPTYNELGMILVLYPQLVALGDGYFEVFTDSKGYLGLTEFSRTDKNVSIAFRKDFALGYTGRGITASYGARCIREL